MFEKPEIEIMSFDEQDIVTLSNPTSSDESTSSETTSRPVLPPDLFG